MAWPLILLYAAGMGLFGYAVWMFWVDDREPMLASIYAVSFAVALIGFVLSFWST